MAKKGFNDADYNHHDGVYGSPAAWSRKAKRALIEESTRDDDLAAALKVLGVTAHSSTVTERTLKTAYRKVVREAHPDRGGSEAAFNDATEAFENAKRLLGVK